ncbi:AAA family ATPase [Streptomyces sp. LX-29]|uniref:helix-turn-helix transcriptional regulator n=1 Tax=Streptomyces sp. LX-29 TaxID=2900152 RepID=UPI00240DD786|nr:helix-turn-helix transcriptional regulator [Streptomyces sp. LX-29]WFB07261.1 AAA family ATPase [Streptomyces sp. LX-29]
MLSEKPPAGMSDACAILDGVQNVTVSPVFVGRGDELTALNAALARAAAGETQALLVGGEAGVGKSRLTEEFLAHAAAAGAVTAVGGCVEIGADGLPFAPFAAVLRALRRQLGDELARAVAGQEGELARLLPELGETTRESPDERGRARLFELTTRLLERLAADRTLVVVIEDLHWADRSTRELLGYLVRALPAARLLVVATFRSDDLHRRHPLRPFLAELDRTRTVRRLDLPRFTRGEVRAQIAGITGAEPEQTLVDKVFQRSEGNAFFVEELTCLGESCGSGISDSLRDLLLVRVEALAEETQRVVRILAKGGSAVEHELLAAVAGLGEDELIEALRTAVGASILRPTAEDNRYRFRHALVREAVLDDMLPGEMIRLARRYAEAVEADPSLVRAEERAARLAGYWYHAHDAAKALPAVLNAAVEARRRYAHAEQLRLLERALELWEDAPKEVREVQRPFDRAGVYPACGCDDEALRHLDLLAEVVAAAYLSGRRERALAVSKQALKMLDHGEDPLRAAWFWTQRSKLAEGLARGDGWAELSRAQELVRGLPPSAVHADVLCYAAIWGAIHRPGADGTAAAERAVELARLVGAETIELNARLTLGWLRIDADVEGGLADLREVCRRAVELGDITLLGRCFTNLTSVLEAVGRSAESVEAAEEGAAILRRCGLTEAKAWVRGNQSESLLHLGRWTAAEETAVKTRRLAGSTKTRGTAATRLADLALARGAWETAERELAAAHEHYGTHDPQPQFVIPLHRLALGLAAARGRLLDARAVLDTALAEGFPPGTQRYAWPLLLAAATAEADARGLPAAEEGRAEVLRRIRAAARDLPRAVPVWEAYALLLEAELLRAEGRDEAAAWERAAAAFHPLDRPYQLAQARHRWAEALLAEAGAAPGEVRDRAAGLLARARETAERLGARPLREETELLARRARLSLDAPCPAPAPGRPAEAPAADPAEALGLTPRERDVLRLVAVGRTNRQIAEELFISPKTASVHVSNILAKLEVSGRGEAGALAHRLRLVDGLAAG